MKKAVSLLVCVSLVFCFPFCVKAYSARSMVIIEQYSRVVIDSVNCDDKMPMASTTKIMTALVVLESLPLDKVVTVPREAVGVEGSSIYLTLGERISVCDLLYGLLLESGNDAAVALAIAASGSVDSFVTAMNAKAKFLGLERTHFTNPSGLPDDSHYTTAYELAIIAAEAMSNSTFAKIVSTKNIYVAGRTFVNHNKLLNMYDHSAGIKTGFTKKAGRCLVSAAKKDGVSLICVTLNAPDDWNDHIAAFDRGFALTDYKCIAKAGDVSVSLVTPDGKKVIAQNTEDVYATVVDGHPLSQKIYAERFVYAPKAKGQTVGTVGYYVDGHLVASARLCLAESIDIEIKKQLFLSNILNFIKGLFK